MAKYQIQTDQGTYEVETDEGPAPVASAPAAQAHPSAYDSPKLPGALSWLQPAVDFANSGANEGMRHVANALSMLPGDTGARFKKMAGEIPQADTMSGKAGALTEGALEYAAPADLAANALKGSGVLAKAATQGAISGGVAGIQSGGDPRSMETAGAMGAGGELAGAAFKGIKALAGAKEPNLQNYSDAFAAVPTQKKILTKALPTLQRDGIAIGSDPLEMKQAINDHQVKLGQQYDSLSADIGTRAADPQPIIDDLAKQQAAYKRGNVVSEENQPYYDRLQSQIDTVKKLAAQNGGKVSFDDLKYLRDGANGKTNWSSPDAEQNLYRGIGNSYRAGMDALAPETTQLNKDWATYSKLAKVADTNVSMGRGTTQSGLDRFGAHIVNRSIGAGVGATMGAAATHLTGIPGLSEAAAVAGGIVGPKLAAPVVQALKNAVDNGSFVGLSAARQNAIKAAASIGDNNAVMKMLGGIPKAAMTKTTADQ